MKKQTKLGLVLAAAAVLSVSVASLVSARGWVQNGADWYYLDGNNEYVTDTIQSSGNAKFYLGEDGAMQRDYFLEDYNENTYYFGQNGAMVTNTWVAIESSRVENQGDYVPDNYWYYFQASGKAMKAASGTMKRTTIDGKKYGFNDVGQMVTGWIGNDGNIINPDDNENPFKDAVYYAGGDNDGVLRSGWVTYYDGYDGDSDYESEYTNLYFYFSTSNNKKYGWNASSGSGENVTKKINGRTYAFSDEGVMLSGWDALYKGVVTDYSYFSGEDDGHQVKKGWVYAVPTEELSRDAYNDDEEKYMYFNNSGVLIRNQFKKINGKFYAFNRTGIMQTGLVLWSPYGYALNGDTYNYVEKADLDFAEGNLISKAGYIKTGEENSDYVQLAPDGTVIGSGIDIQDSIENTVLNLHLFGDDGARKTGTNNVEFADDVYQFVSNASSGNKPSGVASKKYYSLGILLKASPDIRFGIYNKATYSNTPHYDGSEAVPPFVNQYAGGNDYTAYFYNLEHGFYEVLNTGGSRQKGNAAAKKDADGNYWMVEKGSHHLSGIWSVPVKRNDVAARAFTTRAVKYDTIGSEGAVTFWRDANLNTTANRTRRGFTTQELEAAGLVIASANPQLDATTWTGTIDSNRVYVQFTNETPIRTTGVFQSDYLDNTKWVPFGMLDNSGKTCTFLLSDIDQPAAHAYDVIPTNDYFVNCYWSNISSLVADHH